MSAERIDPREPVSPAVSAPVADAAARVAGVQIDGVTKRFGDATALHEAWLKIAEGEFMTLLGPSGCGKTTLLNLIAGFLEADGGEIFVGGRLMTETAPYDREIGVVFQNYALFPHMTVRRNVAFGLRMQKLPAAQIAREVDEMLARVRLDPYAERYPKELSGGQQQRVALARALIIKPKILLLDEPFSSLDAKLRKQLRVEYRIDGRPTDATAEARFPEDRLIVLPLPKSAGR